MTREEMLADLAYARTLAEEGRHAPLLGGAYLLFWGLLNAAAFAAQYAILEGALPHLAGASVAQCSGLAMASSRPSAWRFCACGPRSKPGLTAIGTRAERALWRALRPL
jgi:hypothetical protein